MNDTEGLRDRVATVIGTALPGVSRELCSSVADAVVAELSLTHPCTDTGCQVTRVAEWHARSAARVASGGE